MAPRAVVKACDISVSGVLNENDVETVDGGLAKRQEGYAGRRKIKLVWRNIILFAYLHLAAVYGLWLMLTSAQWKTGIFGELDFRGIFLC
jgi:stearoyl-CoA desaturase (delta-9 desaturase)